jgi:hypothetical protein
MGSVKKRRANSSIRIGSGPAISIVLFDGSASARPFRAAATSSAAMGWKKAGPCRLEEFHYGLVLPRWRIRDVNNDLSVS